jgi:GH3 auxin-responsive promoter
VVRCTGFHNGTPLVEFLSKGAHFANLTGEKVSEYHISGAMADVQRALDLILTAYSVAPCWDDEQPYYCLFVERLDLAGREQGVQLVGALAIRTRNASFRVSRSETRIRWMDARIGSLGPSG